MIFAEDILLLILFIYFIAVPGEPYPLENAAPPAPVPTPSSSNFSGGECIAFSLSAENI